VNIDFMADGKIKRLTNEEKLKRRYPSICTLKE
jgi:hypothetical protein